MSESVDTVPLPPLPYRARPPQVLLGVGAVLLVSAGAAVASAYGGAPARLLLLAVAATAAAFSLRAARTGLTSSEETLAACATGLALAAGDLGGPELGGTPGIPLVLAVAFLVLHLASPTTATWPVACWLAAQLAVLHGLRWIPDAVHTEVYLCVSLAGLAIALFGRPVVGRLALMTTAPWWLAGVVGGSSSAWADDGGRQWFSAGLMIAAGFGLLLARLREPLEPLLGPPKLVPTITGVVAGAAITGAFSSLGPLVDDADRLRGSAPRQLLRRLPERVAARAVPAGRARRRDRDDRPVPGPAGGRGAVVAALAAPPADRDPHRAGRRPPSGDATGGPADRDRLSGGLRAAGAARPSPRGGQRGDAADGVLRRGHGGRLRAGGGVPAGDVPGRGGVRAGRRPAPGRAGAVDVAGAGAHVPGPVHPRLGPAHRPRPRRTDQDEASHAAWRLGAAQLVLAAWVGAASAGLAAVEWYSLPAAAGLLIAAGPRLRHGASWPAWGPGLLVAAVPSAVLAVTTSDGTRAAAVLVVAAAVLVAGARTGIRALLMVGAGTALALALGFTVRSLPWPLGSALVVGTVLLAVGMRRERHPVDGFGRRLADLR